MKKPKGIDSSMLFIVVNEDNECFGMPDWEEAVEIAQDKAEESGGEVYITKAVAVAQYYPATGEVLPI